MKILVVCQYYFPEEFQINNICVSLVNKGHDVTVLTGLPNYPTGIIPEAYRNGRNRYEEIDGVHVIRCFEMPRGAGIFNLAKNYLSFCLAASFKAITVKKDFDVIYVYQLSPVLMGIPGIILKKITGKKLFLYCCDLWPESAKILAKNEKGLPFKISKIISTYIYRNSDLIGIQSKFFINYFQNTHGIKPEKLKYIPQFASENYLQNNFTQKHEGINFVFLGNIGIAQNLDCLVAAVEIIDVKQEYRVHVVGDGSYLNELINLVNNKQLQDKFVFYGRKPTSEMNYFYNIADACILTLSGDTIIGQTIPSKLQGYMAAGKVVIAAIDGPAQEIIKEAECGAVVSAGDSIGLASLLKDFICNKNKYLTCGAAGREYFKNNFMQEQYVSETEKILMALGAES